MGFVSRNPWVGPSWSSALRTNVNAHLSPSRDQTQIDTTGSVRPLILIYPDPVPEEQEGRPGDVGPVRQVWEARQREEKGGVAARAQSLRAGRSGKHGATFFKHHEQDQRVTWEAAQVRQFCSARLGSPLLSSEREDGDEQRHLSY
ncbi:hypothetical protein INR49_002416 [Caranx melampygus]|nr:hypothetical protein INR49_002416 [Caranx melampygus]